MRPQRSPRAASCAVSDQRDGASLSPSVSCSVRPSGVVAGEKCRAPRAAYPVSVLLRWARPRSWNRVRKPEVVALVPIGLPVLERPHLQTGLLTCTRPAEQTRVGVSRTGRRRKPPKQRVTVRSGPSGAQPRCGGAGARARGGSWPHPHCLAPPVFSRSRINEKSVWCCGWLPCTPLRIAATAGHGNCVDFLIRKGAEVDLVDVKGQTALYVAVVNGHLESAQILLEAGADPNGSRHHRSTPVYHASRVGRADILNALIRSVPRPVPGDGHLLLPAAAFSLLVLCVYLLSLKSHLLARLSVLLVFLKIYFLASSVFFFLPIKFVFILFFPIFLTF